jgi:Leucine-rich repeat (LRR) protein
MYLEISENNYWNYIYFRKEKIIWVYGSSTDISYVLLSFLVTLLQIPQFEHLQILICNGNSLTTLAGVENIKHLCILDVGNNQVQKILSK